MHCICCMGILLKKVYMLVAFLRAVSTYVLGSPGSLVQNWLHSEYPLLSFTVLETDKPTSARHKMILPTQTAEVKSQFVSLGCDSVRGIRYISLLLELCIIHLPNWVKPLFLCIKIILWGFKSWNIVRRNTVLHSVQGSVSFWPTEIKSKYIVQFWDPGKKIIATSATAVTGKVQSQNSYHNENTDPAVCPLSPLCFPVSSIVSRRPDQAEANFHLCAPPQHLQSAWGYSQNSVKWHLP